MFFLTIFLVAIVYLQQQKCEKMNQWKIYNRDK